MHHAIDAFYAFLDRIGYMHPIHPAMVHMPIGLVVGAMAFIGMAFFPRFRSLKRSAHHATVLALIFWFPTVIFGVMDWQRYLGGAWLFDIKIKVALAAALLVLLVVAAVLGQRQASLHILMPIYGLCLAVVVVLGYYGGQLVYAGLAPQGPAIYSAGEKVFDNNCTGCHAHGGNVIAPDLPLALAPQLKRYDDFARFLRDPRMPDGTVGAMPPFPAEKIPPEQVRQLYDYIVHVIVKPADGKARP